MKIGLISDTHDNIENIQKSVQVFKENKASIVFHAGDYVSPEAIRLFHGLKLVGVFGNNDFDKSSIRDAFNEIGGQIKDDFCEFEVDDIIFAVYHGTQQERKNSLIESGKYDVVVCGHTHRTLNSKVGKTLVLNPGTAKGWFFGYMATVAMLDTLTKDVTFIDL
ncbi:MAG: metallophosphoesterase [Candidatus Nitrosopolaris sp.]